MQDDPLNRIVIGCAIEVHRTLGPGLLENVYESCLAYELKNQGLELKTQVPLIVKYKESPLDINFRVDIIVESKLLLELKAVDLLSRLHQSQILTYLKLSGLKTGLLINFNSVLLKSGIKKFQL